MTEIEKIIELFKSNEERKSASTYVRAKHIAVECMKNYITLSSNIDKVREEYKANLEYAKEVGDVDFIVAYTTVLEIFDKYFGNKEVE